MTQEEFRRILQGAVAGSHENLEELLQLYMPMINKYSYLDDQLDEDLRSIS